MLTDDGQFEKFCISKVFLIKRFINHSYNPCRGKNFTYRNKYKSSLSKIYQNETIAPH